MFSTSDSVAHGYSVLRAVRDELSGQSTPVGVAAWDTEAGVYSIRGLASDEKVKGVTTSVRVFLQTMTRQLRRWASEGTVPYADQRLSPASDAFWRAASEVYTTTLRIDPPRAIEPFEDFEAELETLYEAVVQPRQSTKKTAHRIDGAVTAALGDLAHEIPSRVEIAAYQGAKARVLRGVVTREKVLVIEGVNLASRNAEDDADALVSRMMRIRAAHTGVSVSTIVGYCASPSGLNGEAHLVQWIQEKLTEQVFDLTRDRKAFRNATSNAWQQLAGGSQIGAFDRD